MKLLLVIISFNVLTMGAVLQLSAEVETKLSKGMFCQMNEQREGQKKRRKKEKNIGRRRSVRNNKYLRRFSFFVDFEFCSIFGAKNKFLCQLFFRYIF